jgi:hypothetical protein
VDSMERKEGSSSALPAGFRRYFGWAAFFLAAILLLSGLAPRIVGQEQAREPGKEGRFPEREDPDIVRLRAQWFFQQRAFPLGFIPAGVRERAIRQMQQMALGTGGFAAITPAINPALTWTPIGPQPTAGGFFGNTSGRVNVLSVDACDATGQTLYLGAANGGVWRTTDAGATWTPLTDTQPSLSTGSIALDTSSCPSGHPNAIYVGTGEENFAGDNLYGEGVLKSSDGGATWSAFGSSAFTSASPFPLTSRISGPFIGAISIQPGNNQTLLAAVQGSGTALQSGIWRSTNGGANWTHVHPAQPGVVGTDVVFDPNDPSGNAAYAALGNPQGNALNGIYKSTNGGLTWSLLNVSASLQPSFGRISLGVGPLVSGQTEIIAAIADANSTSSNLLGVFKTTNAGNTWTQLTGQFVSGNSGFCNAQCFYDMTIRVSPTNANLIFAGGAANIATIIRSTDGGSTWSEASNNFPGPGPHVDTHAFAYSSNGKVFVGNDGGIWSTSNPTAPAASVAWSNLNAGLGITQFYSGHSIHPSTPLVGFGGTQDNGLQKYPGNSAWQDFGIGCDGGFTAVNQQIPSTVYGTCEYIPNALLIIAACLFNGDNCALNGFNVVAGIDGSDRGDFIPPLVIDPSNGLNLYFGTFRLYQTTNGALSWAPISSSLTGTSGVLTTIAVAPSNPNTIYTGSSDSRVQVTTNAGAGSGAVFTDISTGLPPRSVTAVVVDPHVSTTAYATFSGFSGFNADTQGHVFQTTTGGPPWVDISGNLPNTPINDLVVDPDLPNTLYAATDIGVFTTTNANAGPLTIWSVLGAGLPTAEVLSLKLHEPSRTLRAATHGRSVWDLQLNNFTPAFNLASISPVTASAGSPGTTLSLTGNGFTGSSVAQWNGAALTTNVIDANHLTATVPLANFASGGAVPVTVKDGASTSNALVFTVLFPPPGLTSINPTSASAGAANLPLTVTGSNFQNGTIALFNFNIIPTTFVSSTTLNATIPAADLANAGVFPVDVLNPQPGGGPEPGASAAFTVNGFAFGTPVPASVTVSAGGIAPYTSFTTGAGSPIALTATGLPAAATATFTPNPVAPGAVFGLTIATTARSALPGAPLARGGPRDVRGIWLFVLVAVALAMALTLKRKPRRRVGFALALGLIVAFMVVQTGCGGGAGGGGGGGGGTPAGTFTITITGQAGSVTHTTSVTLVVQ